MDYLDAPLQKDCAARLAVVGGSPRMTSGVCFALARRAAERDAAAASRSAARRASAKATALVIRGEPPTTAKRAVAQSFWSGASR